MTAAWARGQAVCFLSPTPWAGPGEDPSRRQDRLDRYMEGSAAHMVTTLIPVAWD
ncbi:hypothetical protein ACFXPI_01710 [Streptomyces sp. NPDC059104]|uniref:hypothetical protein n=1 Tax=Streptomyces sp. NPDC059104 TaxID=3346729 RepID=UPI003680277B